MIGSIRHEADRERETNLDVKVMMDGEYVPSDQAKISVFDHGFLFGDSIYEVVRTRNRKLFVARMHLSRLRYSGSQTGLLVPWSDELLLAEMESMAQLLAPQECYLRLVVSRGVGPMNIDPAGCDHPHRILFGRKLEIPNADVYRDGIRIFLSSIRKNSLSDENGNIKTGNYLDHVLAIRQAREQGCQEALLLNHRLEVAECTTSNIFWCRDGVMYTPALKAGILKGVTRQIVFHLARERGLRCEEGLFPLAELLDADEVFITSTTRDVLAVRQVGQNEYEVGELTKNFMSDFASVGDLNLAF